MRQITEILIEDDDFKAMKRGDKRTIAVGDATLVLVAARVRRSRNGATPDEAKPPTAKKRTYTRRHFTDAQKRAFVRKIAKYPNLERAEEGLGVVRSVLQDWQDKFGEKK